MALIYITYLFKIICLREYLSWFDFFFSNKAKANTNKQKKPVKDSRF